MKAAALLAPLALAGCTHRAPDGVREGPHYNAYGSDPWWLLTIGEDAIHLNFGPHHGHDYVLATRRTEKGVTRWEGGEGVAVIHVEARREPCTGWDGGRHPDRVRVRLSGRELNGCGRYGLLGGRD